MAVCGRLSVPLIIIGAVFVRRVEPVDLARDGANEDGNQKEYHGWAFLTRFSIFIVVWWNRFYVNTAHSRVNLPNGKRRCGAEQVGDGVIDHRKVSPKICGCGVGSWRVAAAIAQRRIRTSMMTTRPIASNPSEV